jgi:hypothetical protein
VVRGESALLRRLVPPDAVSNTKSHTIGLNERECQRTTAAVKMAVFRGIISSSADNGEQR